MVEIQWPALLANTPIPTSFKEIEPNVTRRSQMGAGASKVRRFISRGVVKHPVEFVLNIQHQVTRPDGSVTVHDQREIFLTFFRETLNNGVRPFLFTHPVNKDVMTVRILPENETDHFTFGYLAGRLIPLSLVFEVMP